MIENKDDSWKNKSDGRRRRWNNSSNTPLLVKRSACRLNDGVVHCCVGELHWRMCANTKKLWTTALSALRIINSNYSHLEWEAGQLPVHLTSFPPVAVTVLFFLCFFLYESIHHEHFKRLALQSALNSLSLSHLKLVPMCLESSSILTCSYWGLISIPETLSSVFPGCTAAFLRSTRWKVYFCADNISYIPCLLNAENWTIVCGAVRVPGGSESRLQADSVKGVGFPQRWKITLSYLHRDSMGVERLHGRNEIREKHQVTVLCPLKWWNEQIKLFFFFF